MKYGRVHYCTLYHTFKSIHETHKNIIQHRWFPLFSFPQPCVKIPWSLMIAEPTLFTFLRTQEGVKIDFPLLMKWPTRMKHIWRVRSAWKCLRCSSLKTMTPLSRINTLTCVCSGLIWASHPHGERKSKPRACRVVCHPRRSPMCCAA